MLETGETGGVQICRLEIFSTFPWVGYINWVSTLACTPLGTALEVQELSSPVPSLWFRGWWLFNTHYGVIESIFMLRGVGASRIYQSWDSFEVTDNGFIPTFTNVHLIHVCMSSRSWSKTLFYYNLVARLCLELPLLTQKCMFNNYVK